MKTLIRMEELAKLGAAYVGSLYLGYAAWMFWAWLLVPDLSMLGYVFGPRIGAWVYNLFHHQASAVIIGMVGFYFHIPYLQLSGLVLFGHSAMDRAFGYGLKYEGSFQHTHLGKIGKSGESN